MSVSERFELSGKVAVLSGASRGIGLAAATTLAQAGAHVVLASRKPEALEDADKSDKVRCIILTGSDKAFAAGADITEMADKSFVDMYVSNFFGSETDRFLKVRKPIIAAVAGYALGGGCELAMMCDFIIAADNAKFGQPEINLGVIAGIGGTQRLTRFVGKSKSMEMNLTGRFMDATEAESAGLVSRIVPANTLVDEAMSAAQKIAEKSTKSNQKNEKSPKTMENNPKNSQK